MSDMSFQTLKKYNLCIYSFCLRKIKKYLQIWLNSSATFQNLSSNFCLEFVFAQKVWEVTQNIIKTLKHPSKNQNDLTH